jgi:hypothetical protein
MKSIVCISSSNCGAIVQSYLEKLSESVKCKINFEKLENAQSFSGQLLILVIDQNSILESIELLKRRNQKTIIALNSRKDFKLVSTLKDFFSNIFGFIDLSQEAEYNQPLIKNYVALIPQNQFVDLQKLADELEKIFDYTTNELNRVKDLHERLVKVRLDKYKGVSLYSKFMAGEKSGGEFFDVIQNESDFFFLQVGSDSYLLTSLVLGEIESLKEEKKSEGNDESLESFKNKIINISAENKASLSYCLMNLKSKNLNAHLELKGLGYLYLNNELHSFDRALDLKFRPGQRMIVLSEGAMKNWNLLNPNLTLKEFFQKNKEVESKDLITEFFYELSRHKKGSFLIYDAFAAIVEIDPNTIYEI